MRLYLVRHGQTVLNQKKCYYGNTDVVLSGEGIRQARNVASMLQNVSFDFVVSSPLVRAYDTARFIAGQSRASDIFCDWRLMEQHFGIFEGKTFKELMEQYPKEWDRWNADFSDYRLPGGESFRDVRIRVEAFLSDLPSGKGNMLIAAHKGTLGHLLAAMLKLPLEGYWNFVFDQGAYSVVDLEDGYAIIRKLNSKEKEQ